MNGIYISNKGNRVLSEILYIFDKPYCLIYININPKDYQDINLEFPKSNIVK